MYVRTYVYRLLLKKLLPFYNASHSSFSHIYIDDKMTCIIKRREYFNKIIHLLVFLYTVKMSVLCTQPITVENHKNRHKH